MPSVRSGPPRPGPRCRAGTPPLTASAVAAEQEWRRARADFQRVRGEFAAHEADPLEVLRRPALSDTTVPATGRFVDAFAAAQALDTPVGPTATATSAPSTPRAAPGGPRGRPPTGSGSPGSTRRSAGPSNAW
ncbi:hypothetical protein [Pseudonocardia sp. ICBG1293]|uniref:hypothetical protein n=1 Tax=Pseudonocardia sp. ICBG1293 TaxID=2844382 RepID=UPI001CCC92F2|nr:hypothetical protein [Pseudonocardia sp. ICBG1293]